MSIITLRSELWHPLFVHFPIVVTVLSLLLFIGARLFKNSWWQTSAQVFLYSAIFLLSLALFTGDFAEDVVKRSLCDVRTLHEHEEHAYQTLYFLLTALAANISIYASKNYWPQGKNILLTLEMLGLLSANISLVITGHYGSQLVYEQGAAVKNYKADCTKIP